MTTNDDTGKRYRFRRGITPAARTTENEGMSAARARRVRSAVSSTQRWSVAEHLGDATGRFRRVRP